MITITITRKEGDMMLAQISVIHCFALQVCHNKDQIDKQLFVDFEEQGSFFYLEATTAFENWPYVPFGQILLSSVLSSRQATIHLNYSFCRNKEGFVLIVCKYRQDICRNKSYSPSIIRLDWNLQPRKFQRLACGACMLWKWCWSQCSSTSIIIITLPWIRCKDELDVAVKKVRGTLVIHHALQICDFDDRFSGTSPTNCRMTTREKERACKLWKISFWVHLPNKLRHSTIFESHQRCTNRMLESLSPTKLHPGHLGKWVLTQIWRVFRNQTFSRWQYQLQSQFTRQLWSIKENPRNVRNQLSYVNWYQKMMKAEICYELEMQSENLDSHTIY